MDCLWLTLASVLRYDVHGSMTRLGEITPGDPLIRTYHRTLREYAGQRVEHESGLRRAFEHLLEGAARRRGWSLINEQRASCGDRIIRPDATLRDPNTLPRGYWEAKDPSDDLDAEIRRKIARGYPLSNTIFENSQRAVLFQDRQRVLECDLSDSAQLARLLNVFLDYTPPEFREVDRAVENFKASVPELARGLVAKLQEAHRSNRDFEDAFCNFFTLCQLSLNPNLRRDAVDEMLVQHLLTERLIRSFFSNPDFVRRNAIAAEIERIIDTLTLSAFSRDDFLRNLDFFYNPIERAARTGLDFSEKQQLLNSIYEQFFQGWCVRVADTHGIVYTPPEIVEFMCASVAEVLEAEFGKALGSPDVHILDPCTGTGNFIVHLMQRIPKRDLPRMYREQLFANEVMLLPYYIAALNIEHAYSEMTGRWEPFEGLCFADTLDLAEGRQLRMFTERNTGRVDRQRNAPITVILGNPPYNMGQVNENDNNKNRKYPVVDRRISDTYARDSKATLKNKLSDAYVKFFRWATDRIENRDGVVCFVSNNSFVDQIAFDGMRKHLLQDFTHVDHIDLHGNVRKNPKLSGTTHNVFGIQVGVGITIAVRAPGHKRLRYYRVPEHWRKEEKLAWLAHRKVPWKTLRPDAAHTWLIPEHSADYAACTPISNIFGLHSLGVATNRDEWLYDFTAQALAEKVRRHITNYNYEVFRLAQEPRPPKDIDQFVNNDPSFIKWTDRLKEALLRGKTLRFTESNIRQALYRPFSRRLLYFDPLLVHRRYRQHEIFPTPAAEEDNQAIVTSVVGYRAPIFSALNVNLIPDLHLCAAVDGHQSFPFYSYSPRGERKENITDTALSMFRSHYRVPEISKWDIFHYVYALLHHMGYRAKYADNLKRELPRVPFAPDFAAFAKAGRQLARLHVGYESIEPYPLEFVETGGLPLSYRVESKMRLSRDKTSLQVNPSLTLAGIPPETFDYRLGGRSALEWIIDQYQVWEDRRSGILSDPNRPEDPDYIVRLIGQVVRVSLETLRLVGSLPAFES